MEPALLVTEDGIKGALAMLADAWPNVSKKCESSVWENSLVRLAADLRVDDSAMVRAAMRIIDHRESVAATIGITKLFREALLELGTTTAQVEYDCREEACDCGWLEVDLEDDGTVCLPCPYCTAGERNRRAHPWDVEREKAVAMFGYQYVERREVQIREGLQRYDLDRTHRRRQEFNFDEGEIDD